MGGAVSFFKEAFPPAAQFQISDIPDQTGRVIIVTGGNTGIGYETVKALLLRNAKVYLAARSPERAHAAIEKLRLECGGKEAIFLKLDLASIASIRQAVFEFRSKESVLHVLINNGGVSQIPKDQLTAEGFDMQFGINVIGTYVLTTELIPLLEAGARDSSDGKARVVTVSSSAHYFDRSLWLDTIEDGPLRDAKFDTRRMYLRSKFAQIVFSRELGRRYGNCGIVATAVNPGNIKTGILRHASSAEQNIMNTLFCYPAPMGALTQLWAATSAETLNMNGKYLIPWARVGVPAIEADDPQSGLTLWEWLERKTGHHLDDSQPRRAQALKPIRWE